MRIDFIGDVHGNAQRLLRLLAKLGYRRPTSSRADWVHPEGNVAIFCGDYVDVGEESLLVVEIVMAMVESGCARAIMGNHDFNIAALYERDPDDPSKTLRSHSERNLAQSAATRAEIDADPARGRRALTFIKSLPLWIDMPSFRVAHAHWDMGAIAALKACCGADGALTESGFAACSRRDTPLGDARRSIQCGPDHVGEPFKDRLGHVRTKVRTDWWNGPADDDPRPFFFGHYAFRHPLEPIGGVWVCVDAGIAHGGRIGSYSHQVGRPLDKRMFSYG